MWRGWWIYRQCLYIRMRAVDKRNKREKTSAWSEMCVNAYSLLARMEDDSSATETVSFPCLVNFLILTPIVWTITFGPQGFQVYYLIIGMCPRRIGFSAGGLRRQQWRKCIQFHIIMKTNQATSQMCLTNSKKSIEIPMKFSISKTTSNSIWNFN